MENEIGKAVCGERAFYFHLGSFTFICGQWGLSEGWCPGEMNGAAVQDD